MKLSFSGFVIIVGFSVSFWLSWPAIFYSLVGVIRASPEEWERIEEYPWDGEISFKRNSALWTYFIETEFNNTQTNLVSLAPYNKF